MSHKNSSRVFKLPFRSDDLNDIWRDRAWIAVLAGLIILPFLGSFGLWDPWETHYGEVGRQITERSDWISTWWGSHWQDAKGNQEGAYFFSKPIFLMWLMALGLEVFGVNEWGIRIGTALVAILGIVLFAEPATAMRLGCIALIVAGIAGLKFAT